jgi:hypothetical protein
MIEFVEDILERFKETTNKRTRKNVIGGWHSSWREDTQVGSFKRLRRSFFGEWSNADRIL